MALRARSGGGALQQRQLPCRGSVHACSAPTASSSTASGLISGSRAMQQASHPHRQLHVQRCRRHVACSAAGGNSGDSASKAIAWAVNAARRTFRLKGSDTDPQQQQQQQSDGNRADASAGAAQPSGAAAAAEGSGSSAREASGEQHKESFESWREFIDQMDEGARMSTELDQLLNQAVDEERYDDAARLRRQMEDLIAEDTVGSAMDEMDDALADERYADAARIRDEAHTGLIGWWAGRGENDPYGHLLHVSPGFGCYTGRAYLPKSLFEIKEYVNTGQLREDDVDSVLVNMGQPLLEVFLRRDEEADRLRTCSTVIVPADFAQMDGDTSGSGSDDEDDEERAKSLMKLTGMTVKEVDEEGRPTGATPTTNEVLEALKDEVMRQLKMGMHQQQPPPEDGTDDHDAFNDITFLGGTSGDGSGGDLSSSLGGIIELGGGTIELGDAEGTTITVEVTASPGAQVMARNAADLRRFGKDRFVIQALKDADNWDGQQEGADGEDTLEQEDSGLERRVLAALTDVDGSPADISRLLGDTMTDRLTGGRRAARQASDIGRQDRSSLVQIADFDSEEPDVQKVRNTVAQEVRRLQAAHAAGTGPAVDRDTIRGLIRKVTEKWRAEQERKQKAQEDARAGAAAALDPSNLFKGRVSYRRIPSGLTRTDPFSGTYLAAFGPHGIEMLLLSRSRAKNGHEIVTARKLTGDPNVPAGEVSFTANIDRAARLDPSEYPDMLCVTARYAGKGLIAQPGFTEPKWVEGELLQFAEASPVTQGARLGFVWATPGQKRYLVLLNRVGLDENE